MIRWHYRTVVPAASLSVHALRCRRRIDRISKAVERGQRDIVGKDTAYVIAWLAFEAQLLVRSGRFQNEQSKRAVERALERAVKAVKEIA